MKRFNDLDLRQLKPAELEALSDEIAEFLASGTRFDIDTIIKNLNVLETTLALHTVFDLRKDRVVFDGGSQVMVHKVLTGRSDELELRTNIPLNLTSTNPYDAYQGGEIGEGLGVALAYAMETNRHVLVVLDDHVLNYGITYETLVQISRHKPNLTIVMIDEQQSLLRHYNSFDSIVKSIRISKAYTGIKKDMKAILDSNPVSRPIFNTLVKMRDALKETVLEPTIFTQFGIGYQGPIDGQNIQELIRVFNLSKTLKGPQIIHVQTRLRMNGKRRLDFPAFKTDNATPENYRTYHELFDETLTNKRNPKLMLLVDALNLGDYFREFEESYPNNYKTVSGSTQALITNAAGYARLGYHVILVLSATRMLEAVSELRHQFVVPELPITLLIRKSGLSFSGNVFEQGVFDVHALADFASIYYPKNAQDAANVLDAVSELDGIHAIRYQNIPEKITQEVSQPDEIWTIEKDFHPNSKGVVLTFGPSVLGFVERIQVNDLDIGVINCRAMNHIDGQILQRIAEANIPVLIYDVEDLSCTLKGQIQDFYYQNKTLVELISFDLKNVNLNLASKELKRSNALRIEDALNRIIEG